jgi:sugar O-acyltransferase (sialic acid O-acetyltransferase NeuD family)
MENPVIIFGASGFGALVLDIFQRNGVVVYGFLDDNSQLHQTEIGEVSVLGDTDDDGFLKLIGKKCEAFVAIEDRQVRKKTVQMLHDKRHIQPVNAIHDTATVSQLAQIGHGNLINTGAKINATATVGHHNIIQTNAVIEYNATLGDFINIGPNATIGSGATIADNVFVGAGAIIVSGVTIAKGASIGAGSVVIADVLAGERIFGNPAKKM